MELDNRASAPIIKGDEIDLMALVRTVWVGRRIILYTIIGCLLIGIIIAYTSPKKYTASATLLPSEEKKGGNLGGLSALAGMAGINIGNMMGDASGIPAELYPQVVGSVPYLMELMNEKLTWEKSKEPLSIYEKLEQKEKVSRFSDIIKYTIGLPWVIKDDLLTSSKNYDRLDLSFSTNSDSIGYYNLSAKQRAAIGMLKEAIIIEKDKESGLISVTVTMSEPLLCAQLADKAVTLLQKYIIDYKTKQGKENLTFIEERYAESKTNYENSQRALFNYKDSHRNIIAERTDVEYQRLSDAYDIASAIYKGLAQQKEQVKISVKEETPVFTVLDPVVVPKDKSAPKRGMILALSLAMGLFCGIIVSLATVVLSENIKHENRLFKYIKKHYHRN